MSPKQTKDSTAKETKGESTPPKAEQERASATKVTEPQEASLPAAHGTVMAGKRYDFSRARSDAGQEEYQGIPIRQSYEDVRDDLSHKEARALWRDGDRRKAYLRESMQAIHDDPNLSDEGKRDAAQHLIESNAPHILKGYEDARAKLEASAESSWKFSVPMPNDKTLATTAIADTSEMIAVQNEAGALAQRIEGKSLQALTQERSKDPRSRGIRGSSNHRLNELKAEFDSAMHTGGVEGRIKAFAIKRLCEAKGVSLDDVVDSHRRQSHRNAYRDAEVFERAYSTVPASLGRGLDTNPYDSRHGRRGAKAVGAYSSGNRAVSSSGRPQLFAKKNRKRPWK
jgi:hypothetical protein